jgi:pyruvate formate lyase activating enzyme
MIKGTVFNIKRFSVHDGPGIRTSIFLKGCPLNCIWCHNPEGISASKTIWYDRSICILCGRCTEVCPEKALKLSLQSRLVIIDRNLCLLSGSCVENCPTGAISFTCAFISSDEIMKEIRKDVLFFEKSGGGVTITGGEPLFQPDFCMAILKACKKDKISTAIETSLYCDRDILEGILSYTDLFIVDFKIFDSGIHEKYTGKSNHSIKENLRYLAGTGKEILVRIPLIKGITDKPDNIEGILGFIKDSGRSLPVEYLDYNPLAAGKYKKLSIDFPLEGIKIITTPQDF